MVKFFNSPRNLANLKIKNPAVVCAYFSALLLELLINKKLKSKKIADQKNQINEILLESFFYGFIHVSLIKTMNFHKIPSQTNYSNQNKFIMFKIPISG